MVYVKQADAKTKEKYLVSLDGLIYAESTDLYAKAVLTQIKGLVDVLGLTKEDYLQYIQETYGVERTGRLWPTEIFEVVTHFQKLFFSIFGDWLEPQFL
jgi:hypothetical protein